MNKTIFDILESVSALTSQMEVINKAYTTIIEDILGTCEDNTLTFSVKDDDEDNFRVFAIVDGREEYVLVRNVHIDNVGRIWLTTEDGQDRYPREVYVGYNDLIKYMVDEIERKINNDDDETYPYVCPNCGERLRKDQVEYDYDSGNVVVGCCPWCGEEGATAETAGE